MHQQGVWDPVRARSHIDARENKFSLAGTSSVGEMFAGTPETGPYPVHFKL